MDPEDFCMKDDRGREVKIDSRVSVKRRPATSLLGEDYLDDEGKLPLPGFRGRVIRLDSEGVVTIKEFDSHNWRTIELKYVHVQYGEYKESNSDAIIHGGAKTSKQEASKPKQVVQRK